MRLFLTLAFSITIATQVQSQNFDIKLLRDIHLHRNKQLDPTFRFFTKTATPISIAAPFVVFGIGYIEESKDIKQKALYLGETALCATVIATTLKYVIKRDRPFETYPEIIPAAKVDSPSFPSGHTSAAFACATSLTLAFPKLYVAIPAYAWASTVAYSRMHLGVHYPTDVLGGIITGSGSAWLCKKANTWIAAKNNKAFLEFYD
jgi:membrane-associated phospholipid phosphatase